MKLPAPLLSLFFLLPAASTVLAADEFKVVNTRFANGQWEALAVWNRGDASDRRGLDAAEGCREHPYLPWPDVSQVCFDWANRRGHIRVGTNTHCFRDRNGDSIVYDDNVRISTWYTDDCTWST
ncbi:hypothetical protein V8F33_011151 [Rhypophila sp. PSN 637]